jgi:HK97 family phage portal protein
MGRLRNLLFGREPERRLMADTWSAWAPSSVPYVPGAPNGAQSLSAVLAATNFIASNVASLPPLLYAITADGRRTEHATHSVNRVLQQPSPGMTWPETTEYLIADVLLWGNTLAVLDYDMSGRLVSVTPVPWRYVTSVALLPSGSLVYDVTWYGRPTVRYLASEVIHLRDRGDHTYIGRSRISRAAASMQHAASADTAALSMFDRSARPSGAFKFTSKLTDVQRNRFQEAVDQATGAARAGKVLVLQDGVDFVPFTNAISGRDAEILASRAWSTIDIARVFAIPPVLLGDYQFARGPVALEAMTVFALTTLRHWVTRFEAAFNAAVFGASTGARFALALDMSALQRADPAAHTATDNVLLSHGVLTPNEVREAWGYSPSTAPGMDEPSKAPQAAQGGTQITGTQMGGMAGADGMGGQQ